MRNPLQTALGFTAAALLFVFAGSIGYDFSRQVGHYWGHWAGAPVVSEILLGVGCGLAAAFLWRRALGSA
jgi:hypothetical protein